MISIILRTSSQVITTGTVVFFFALTAFISLFNGTLRTFLYETLSPKKGIIFRLFYGFLFHNTFITVTS